MNSDLVRRLSEVMEADSSTVVWAAYAVLVHRYTGQEEVRMGTDVPVRVLLTGRESFREIVHRVQRVLKEAPERLNVEEMDLVADQAQHLQMLIQGFANDPERPVSGVPMVTEVEWQDWMREWNQTAADYPKESCLHELFEEQAAQTPDRVGVVSGAEQLTYEELNQKANQVAHLLRRKGVQPGDLVGIWVDRSVEMMVGLLGILKAGGTYVPFDPAYPKARLSLILEEAELSILLTQARWLADVPQQAQEVICLDRDWETIAKEDATNPERVSRSSQRAYVIFTSGSTGRPKGVQIPHSAVVNLLNSMRKQPGIDRDDVYLALASFAFDMSIPELYLPLVAGAKLVLGKQGLAGDGERLLDTIRREGVSIMQATPTTWRLLLEAGLEEEGRLRVLCGAEPLPPQLLADLLAAGFAVWNLYGPTETTVWSMMGRIADYQGGPLSIGTPVDNTEIYIVNDDFQPVPNGVAGELLIGGAGVAIGYLNRPELTAEKFIPHPFREGSGARLYRTGDLARRTADGEIECLGRIDHQVKIRGFRVELGEVESQLAAHPAVRGAVVLAGEDERGHTRLVGYAQCHAGVTVSGVEMREFLQDKLPAYMIPTAFVVLEEFPLNANGKVDRKALPAPRAKQAVSTAEYAAPRNEWELQVTRILEEVLSCGRVGIHDQFLALGGDSLLAARAISRVRRLFRTEVEVRSLLEAPTVADFAALVAAGQEAAAEEPRLVPTERSEGVPLSFSQQRLWFLDQLEEGKTAFYNLPLLWMLRGSLDASALERSLQEIVRRHEALRTVFKAEEGQPVQVILPPVSAPLPICDLREVPADERQLRLMAMAQEEADWRFDLASGPLFRARLIQLAEQEHALLVNMHHIVSDGWSLALLRRELVMLYDAYAGGAGAPFSELPIQYADYCVWQQERMQGAKLERHLNYWRRKLGGSLPILELPADRPRGDHQTFAGQVQRFELTEDVVLLMQEAGKRDGFTPFMVLMAAYQLLLAHLAQTEDVIVGSPVANRGREELEDLIGFFVNTLVYRTDLSGNPTLREVLKRVRETAYEAYAHQETPFEKVVEAIQPKRDLRFPPLFQVWFVLHNTPAAKAVSTRLEVQAVPVETGTVQFDLSLAMEDRGRTYAGELSYNCDLFEAETIERLVRLYELTVRTLVGQPQQRTDELYRALQEEIQRQKAAKQRSFKESRLAKLKNRTVQTVQAER